MQVHTRRFGSIVVDDDEVYAVPNGIPGFPELRRVVLLGAGPAPGVNPGDDSSSTTSPTIGGLDSGQTG